MSRSRLSVMFDVSSVPYGRGVSRYTSNLATALSNRLELELTLFGYSWRQHDMLQQWAGEFGSHVQKRIWKIPPSLLEKMWVRTGFPSPVRGVDIYHAWESQLPATGAVPFVVTIHDLAHMMFPETAHPKVVERYKHLLWRLEKDPRSHVIAVSHATKQDILNLTSLTPDRVHVVHEALPQEARIVPSEDEVEKTKRELQIKKPFLLFVGTTEPRKNLKNIIAAWKKVRKEFDLVIAGAQGWEEFTVEPGMHMLGYVSPSQLACLYRLAHALVFISLSEGFGLPILEAYFHGCPVITSRVSSMPEIGGKPGLYVDPYDVEGVAEAILALEAKDSRARRQREKDMREVLENFSWERAAKETMNVYQLTAEER